jgi:hypothetical protein
MAAETARPAKTMRKKREKVPEEQLERRVSFRERKPINYCEMMERAAREAREPVDHSARIAVRMLKWLWRALASMAAALSCGRCQIYAVQY